MIYKIRVILDTKEDIFRDIEIKELQTLWNLHLGIISAFSLQGEELSLFNILESDGTVVKTIPLEDMSDEGDGEIMSDVYINEAFEKVGDKAQFQFGFMDLWEFFCELVEIVEEKPAVNYPITAFRFGNVPLKAPGKSSSSGKSRKSAIPLIDDEDGDNFGFNDEFGNQSFEDEDDDIFDDEEEETYHDEAFDDEEEI